MKLLDKETGRYRGANIKGVSEIDYTDIANDNGFSFNWDTEKKFEVYKIFLTDNEDIILGLISLIDLPHEYRIHLNLLEVRIEHQGKEKQIDLIAGCLIAFAAENALKRGYYGFVSLMPKTKLIELYQKKYGFQPYGRYLAIEGIVSQKLIKKYLEDE